MSEINLNGVGGSSGIGRPLGAAAGQKNGNVLRPSTEADSAEFSQLPDLADFENAVEKEFEGLQSSLRAAANSEFYPPLETIDKLAAMLAIEVKADPSKPV
jgi:hypothetical protein